MCPSHCVPLCSAQFLFVVLLEMSTMISYLRLYLPDFSPIKLLITFYNQYFVEGGALRLYNILVLINLPAAGFSISLCFLAELLLWWLLNDDILISSFLSWHSTARKSLLFFFHSHIYISTGSCIILIKLLFRHIQNKIIYGYFDGL